MSDLAALQRIFRDVFDDEDLRISESSAPDNVKGWDSIVQVKLILSIESEFDIHFETDEVAGLRSVGAFLTGIAKHRKT